MDWIKRKADHLLFAVERGSSNSTDLTIPEISKYSKLNRTEGFIGSGMLTKQEIDFDKFRARIYERVEREPFTLEEDEDLRMKLEAQNNTNKK